MSFYGKSYRYPTPEHGEKEIGVDLDPKHPGVYIVGWWFGGTFHRLHTPHLKAHPEPAPLQEKLDAFAIERKLKPDTVRAAKEQRPGEQSSRTILGDASAWTGLLGDEKPVRQTDDAVTAGTPPEPVTALQCSDGENGGVQTFSPKSTAVTAVRCSKSAPALARCGVVVDAPSSVEEATAYIRQQLQVGVHTDNRIGVALVWMLEMSGQKVSPFIYDARQTFNVSERQLYTYLKGGRLLLSGEFAGLPDELKKKMVCGVFHLELLAPVAEKGVGVLRYFLEHNDPRAMTREELDLKVDLYMTKLLPEAEKEAAQKKAQEKAKEKSIGELRKALKPLADIPDEELVTAARRVGAARVFDNGLRMVAAAVDSQIAGEGTVTPEAVAQWRASLEAALAELGKIGQA